MSQHPKAYLIEGGTVSCTMCPGQDGLFIGGHSIAKSYIEGMIPGVKLDNTLENINFGLCQLGPRPGGPPSPPLPCVFAGEWLNTVIPGQANEPSLIKESKVAICKTGKGIVTVKDTGQASPFPVVNFGEDGITEEDIALYLLYSPEAFAMLDAAKNGKVDGIISMKDLKAFLADAEGSPMEQVAGQSFMDMLNHIVHTDAGQEDWEQIEGNDWDSKMSRKDLEKAANNYLTGVVDDNTLDALVNALPEQKGRWEKALDAVQTGLDIVGMIPGLGEWADALNALIYVGRGDYLNAALCMASMIPVGGQAATLARMAKKAGGELAQKIGKEAAENFINQATKKVDDIAAARKARQQQAAARKKATDCGDPVNPATGEVYGNWVDFELPGPIPFVWERNYYSQLEYEGYFGHRWQGSYELYLEIYPEAIYYFTGKGYIKFRPIEKGESYFNLKEKTTLKRDDFGKFSIYDHKNRLTYHFQETSNKNKYLVTSIQNQYKHSIEFKYDNNQLTQVIDSAKRILELETDYDGRIVAISHKEIDGNSILMSYKYDKDGDLIKTTNALGKSDFMIYTNHLLHTRTNRNEVRFNWRYDGIDILSKCIKTWGDNGKLRYDFTYLDENKTITINGLDRQTTYLHQNGLVHEEIDIEGNSKKTKYNGSFQLVKTIDKIGRATSYTYDEMGNRTSIIYPDGSLTKMEYKNDRLVALTNQNNATWKWAYNQQDELKSKTDPTGETIYFKYNKDGLLKTVADAQNRNTSFKYDEQYNLIETTFFNDKKNTWKYDNKGNCIKTTDIRNNVRQYNYDLLNRITKINQADGNITHLKYDAYDGVLQATDKHHNVEFEYTELGSLRSRTEKGRKIKFIYNVEEELDYIKNEKGNTYRFNRNDTGQIIEEIGFDGLTRKYLRDAAGQVNTVLRPNDKVTNYKYDDNGRIYKVEHEDGNHSIFGYDKAGNLIEAVNRDAVVTFGRDAVGRIIEETQNGVTVNSKYNANGRSQITSSLGADIQLNRNEQTGLVENVKAKHNATSVWEAQIKRDATGLEIERSLPGAVKNTLQRDKTGNVIEHKTSKRDQILRQKTYTWDVNNRLKSIIDSITHGQIDFDHDSFGNLIGATYPDGTELFKTADEVGNLFKTKDQSDRKYGDGSKLLQSKEWKYKYDEEGNLTEKQHQKNKENWTYQWQANGMLKAVERPDSKTVSFKYDALGRRIEKTYNGTTCRWVWDGNVPLHEWTESEEQQNQLIDEAGKLAVAKPEDIITWIFDEGSFVPAAKIVDEETYSIITDYLGTPTEMYNSDGEKTWACELDIYGKVRNLEVGSLNDCPFRYQGQYEDVETDLYYNRFRYYSPDEGTYISQDPIKYWGGLNQYSYVFDVLSYVDCLGWEDIWYRSLNPTDISNLNNGGNIIPKDVTATNSALEHVLKGSTDGYGDQYISLTKDRGFAENWARKSGTEVAEIDLDKVTNSTLDLSTAEGRQAHLGNAGGGASDEVRQANKWAKGAQELLVDGEIPNDAVVNRYKPPC